MDGGDGGRLRSSPERRASTDLCDAPPMSVGQQVRSAKPYRPSRLQESARSGVLSIYEDITAERGSSEAYILSMFSGRERSAAERREGASARQSWLSTPTFETAHTPPEPRGGPRSEFSRLPEVIPVRGDRTDVYAVHAHFPAKERG